MADSEAAGFLPAESGPAGRDYIKKVDGFLVGIGFSAEQAKEIIRKSRGETESKRRLRDVI